MDSDGYQPGKDEVKKKLKELRQKRREESVFGTRQHGGLKGVPKTVDLFVFNVSKEVDMKELENFLKNEENIAVFSCENSKGVTCRIVYAVL